MYDDLNFPGPTDPITILEHQNPLRDVSELPDRTFHNFRAPNSEYKRFWASTS